MPVANRIPVVQFTKGVPKYGLGSAGNCSDRNAGAKILPAP